MTSLPAVALPPWVCSEQQCHQSWHHFLCPPGSRQVRPEWRAAPTVPYLGEGGRWVTLLFRVQEIVAPLKAATLCPVSLRPQCLDEDPSQPGCSVGLLSKGAEQNMDADSCSPALQSEPSERMGVGRPQRQHCPVSLSSRGGGGDTCLPLSTWKC